MPRAGVAHQPGVGEDHRVDIDCGSGVDGARPARVLARLGIGVDREQDLCAPRVRVAHAFAGLGRIEVEAGKVARIGVVAQADVYAIGAVVDCGFERRQCAGGTDELGFTHSRITEKDGIIASASWARRDAG
jgi:hypothetical protein